MTVGAAACSAPGGPGAASNWDWRPDAGTSSGDGSAIPQTSALTCTPAKGSLDIPARAELMSGQAATGGGAATVFTEDLFNLFKSNCGGCHVETSLGNFHVTSQTFATTVDQTVLKLVMSDDPAKYMPPAGAGGMPFSARAPSDPIAQLASLLTQWIAQGRPDELFTVTSSSTSPPSDGFMLSPQVGSALTNIGDCVPSKAMFATSSQTMDQMDAFFASATALPDTLDQTDLTTLDGATLAQVGVIAYAPGYPLWSDDSGKLRYIRVPRGQSVKFNKDKQTFDIPANTRFYKTFLKKVVDLDGSDSWRKIETRIIVARPDQTLADGTVQQTALFGTYVWNDDETSATLSKLPLRDGAPFGDSLIEYTIDEPREKTIRDGKPANLKYALENASPPLKRHYAIPGSPRCIQCHMGSPNADFVLGFLPLQVARRATDTGGVYESTGADEMTQLQRFIDYGVITGMAGPSDVVALEQSEGTRAPRNDYELQAQAYLLGNCAHCHNPRGYPSVKNPALKDALNFLPTATSGVFQFPLDRVSPLRQRGANQDVPLPYITPSLREFPVGPVTTSTWVTKWVASCASGTDDATKFLCKDRTDDSPAHLSAPWRSLLYRNVDTPFMYADDFVVFPHMPMNSAGYDCRVAPIMGDWMVSIPAARKNPEIDEDAVPGGAAAFDTNPQPYVEVLPGDDAYPMALDDATTRLAEYHASGRYGFCPDTSDIVDPAVVQAGGNNPIVPAAGAAYDPKSPTTVIQPDVGVPLRAHWVITDLTDPPGDWYPRRPDWDTVVVENMVDMTGLPTSVADKAAELQVRREVLDGVRGVTLTDELKAFVLTDRPYGLWQSNPGCDFSSVPKAGDIAASERPRWMATTAPAADAPVYMQSPALAVFNNICFNCHGPQADARGLLADAIMNMTGGTARVANFRDGLFGPVSAPGANRSRVFGPDAITAGITADDMAGRYMSWMALGGTQAKIPISILNIVATTRILGTPRSSQHLTAAGSPNMLKLAQELCSQVLPVNKNVGSPKVDDAFYRFGTLNWTDDTALIDTNFDAEMWQHLCSLGNRPVVRVPFVNQWAGNPAPVLDATRSFYWGDAYPSDAPVLDSQGRLAMGIHSDNAFPMCFQKPTNPQDLAAADAYIAAHPVGGPGGALVPYCPAALFETGTDGNPKWQFHFATDPNDSGIVTYTDANQWAIRGAINAGLSVFLYVDQLTRGNVLPKPQFNHCEQLATPAQ